MASAAPGVVGGMLSSAISRLLTVQGDNVSLLRKLCPQIQAVANEPPDFRNAMPALKAQWTMLQGSVSVPLERIDFAQVFREGGTLENLLVAAEEETEKGYSDLPLEAKARLKTLI